MTMTRTLGRSGVEISALGMGCWAIGGPFHGKDGQPYGWGEVDDAESTRAIHAALDKGVTFFDTADVYGAGHSERVLGAALKGKRDKVVIATKWGNMFCEEKKEMDGVDASPDYVRWACNNSLRRLGTDYIDLYQFHLNDYPAEKAEPLIEALEGLVKEGKIRWYGWSTDFPDRARSWADRGAHCTSIQHDFCVVNPLPEVLPVCEEFNLASINRGPLGMGLLTGKYTASSKPLGPDDVRGKAPGWMVLFKDGKATPEALDKLAAIREILTRDGRTLAQGALGWLWARSSLTIPIPGFRTVAQVEENAGALALGALPAEDAEEAATIITG
ncbi:MAG: aldo/keto reductase [Demequinaceae bacterium]|nr:aldo/keto reductase [Demequinaceae bacterium]